MLASRPLRVALCGVALVTGAALVPTASASASTSVLVNDGYSRTVDSGLGSTSHGKAYTVSGSGFSVDGDTAVVRHSSIGKRLYADLKSTSARDVGLALTLDPDRPGTGWGQTVSVVVRKGTDQGAYEGRVRMSGSQAWVGVVRRDGSGAETLLGDEAQVPLSADQAVLLGAGELPLRLRVEAGGASPTTLKARAWVVGQQEPSSWLVQRSDSTASLADAGSVGISTYTSTSTTNGPTTFGLDNLYGYASVTTAEAHPAQEAPEAGAVPLGTARYAVPSGAKFVALNGSDSTGTGTSSKPWRTIHKAVSSSASGSTIVVRGGTYRESVSWYGKALTIQNYPGEAVWLSGTDVVTGWVADGGDWRKDGWTARFQQGGRSDLIQPSHPYAAHPDMVFVNGSALRQVGSRSAVAPGTFWVDYANKRLYVGTDPSGKSVEAAARDRALHLNQADGSSVRGIGVQRYANHPNKLGAVFAEGDRMRFENLLIRQNASVGLTMLGTVMEAHGLTLADNGQIGLHGHQIDGVTVMNSLFERNNNEHFKLTGAQGGLKITTSKRVTLAENVSRDNDGRGLWCDEACYDVKIVYNTVLGNADRGVQFEISSRAVIASNLIANNGSDGISVIESNDVDVFNNTLYRNTRGVFAVENNRSSDLGDVVIRNNLITETKDSQAQLVAVEDVRRQETAAQMGVSTDANGFHRTSSSSSRWWAGWADYPSGYDVYTTFRDFQSQKGQERNGLAVEQSSNPFLVNPAGGDFSRRDSFTKQGVALPSNVAAALGVGSGTVPPLGALHLD